MKCKEYFFISFPVCSSVACRSEVSVKPRGIQVSTYHAHNQQSEHTWQQSLVTISEDILTIKYDFYL